MNMTKPQPDRVQILWDLGVPAFQPQPVPDVTEYDVAIIGAGFSGLTCALELAKRGASVLVLEQGAIGHGASGRNGGMVGPSFHKLGMTGLTKQYGADKARDIMQAGMAALDHFEAFVEAEGIDCDLSMQGRFRGARSTADLVSMEAECKRLNAEVGLPYRMVSRAEVGGFISSDAYVGGVYYPRDGGVHPKRLVNALAARAEARGAHLRDHTPVSRIVRDGSGFRLEAGGKSFAAKQVVMATNGYSDARTPGLNARLIPINVTVAATRDLGENRIRSMSPQGSMHGETGRVFLWYRPSPDGRRFIFGGRICREGLAMPARRAKVAAMVGRIFPELEAEDYEHIWHGKIAYSLDHAPHIGQIDGVWYLGGYCGSGVTRSVYFASKLARKILGQAGGETPFDDLPFAKVPFRPFAPLGVMGMTRYYRWLDQRDMARGMR
jgi:glycine/D-amino acid oxidase-like deaminating enzyme